MNTPTTTPHHNLQGLAIIYGVSAAAIFILAIILIIACFYSRRRPHPRSLQTSHDGAAAASDDEDSVIIELGLKEDVLKSYPKIIYRQFKLEKVESDSSFASSCSICLAEYNDNDVLILLPDCSHFFHFQCIDAWLKFHTTCPICRKSPPGIESTDDRDNRIAPFNLWFVPFMRSTM